jgi:hypothetical protein
MEGLVAAEIGRPPTSVEYDPTESDDGVLRCYFDDTGILGVPFSAEISYGLIAESIAKKFITHPHIRGRGFHESGSWITTNEDGSICLYL